MQQSLNIDRLEADVARATEYLASLPAVRRFWLFGSVGQGRTPDWRSDLDFAVEGLDAYAQFGTWSELDFRLSFPVDLVRWEDASPTLQKEILKGRLLYEA